MSGFDNRLCVVWGTIEGIRNGSLNFLVYGDKQIRTYTPDNVDPRVADTPLVETLYQFGKHLELNPNKPCRVRVGFAKQVATVKDEEFSFE